VVGIPGINHLAAVRALERAGFRVVRQGPRRGFDGRGIPPLAPTPTPEEVIKVDRAISCITPNQRINPSVRDSASDVSVSHGWIPRALSTAEHGPRMAKRTHGYFSAFRIVSFP
jgi:hypothetical protein